MALFLRKSVFFIALCLLSFALVFSRADGTTDAFYLKFTTPKQSSLIIGSSRAAQALIPSEIKTILPQSNFFNYSFTIVQSAFGKIYYNSILKKLEAKPKRAQFIIDVNPWTLSTNKNVLEDSTKFREVGSYLDNTYWVNTNPNFEYLTESYQSKNIDIITNKSRKGEYQTFFVNEDGWLEVTIESDMVSLEERTRKKYNIYKGHLKRSNGLSATRMHYLKKTIETLKKYGDVYLVRIPINEAMLELEQSLMPNFNDLMTQLSTNYKVPYFDEMPNRERYKYTDGHHLTIESAKNFSKLIAERIKSEQNKE